jgi:acetyl-CoA C-acetyltransferase
MSRSVIVAGSRTPIGKLSGSLASLRAVDLGAHAIAATLARAGVDPSIVDTVIMGHVLQAGTGQITARQAAVGGGVPMSVHATTINKVCLSGLQSLYLADLMIRSGDAGVVIAGGMESMTNAPYLLPGARAGYRYGDHTVVDCLTHDGLTCAFDHCGMGVATERYNAGQYSRARQDAFAARSHQLAAAAQANGLFDDEIAPLTITPRKGDPVVLTSDEGVRASTDVAALARLSPAFDASGTITAGNASQISDGGAALLVMSADRAAGLGLDVLGELVSYGQVAGPDASLLRQPAHAIREAARRGNVALPDLSFVEINEAFAAVALASMDELGLDESSVNPNGGAIALGHPIGMSGTRLALTALYELRRRGGGLAAVSLCGGGGQGDAAVLLVR